MTKRAIALPVAAVSALGLSIVSAGAAQAVTSITGGTVTLTVNASFIAQLAKSGVVLLPTDYASLTYNTSAQTVAITYDATGGDANLTEFAGSVDYSGGVLGFSLNGHAVDLNTLSFDLGNAQFDGATSTSDGDVPLVDLSGSLAGNINGVTQTFFSTDLVVDPAGAALLDSALHTTAFYGGQDVGSFTTTWTTG